MLKMHTLREMTREEIVRKRADLLDEQFNLNMRLSLKQLDNPLRLRLIRRELARVLTALNEDKLGIINLAQEKTTVLPQAAGGKKKSE